jgi:hypothetical protein
MLFLQGCASDDAGDASDASDGDGCYWHYVTPGCGENAPGPICKATDQVDGCGFPYCSCEGVTFPGCGEFSMPFAHAGPCDAGSD